MPSLEHYVGQTLDDKYRLERLLGQGGMGAVYLATHLGTDRYVALKLIMPQFMLNPEFVERFKREARAAGRLRHPNVVDVTDFGFSGEGSERVAYLVMEYLDGCTLSDVLAEEDRLPLYWAVDILEQVCAAVHEAHQQGIVHRDLKPDNIWLEPNTLGGYRVKVLDFGIAKLGEVGAVPVQNVSANRGGGEAATLIVGAGAATQPELTRAAPASANNLESKTLVHTQSTINQPNLTQQIGDGDQTRLFAEDAARTGGPHATVAASDTGATAGLTRVGSILGTPLYMSPEQCRGEHLDARSDIYSLGVIAYQMLAGAPPFTGDTASVIQSHNDLQPTVLREHNRKLPKRVSRLVMSALEKDPAVRPQTAIGFGHAMRANADGLGALYRRAFALYSQYFPKFLKLSLIAHIPVILVTLMLLGLRLAEPQLSKVAVVLIGIPLVLLQMVATFLTSSIICGVTAILVTQLEVAPMKPVELHAAFRVLRSRLRPFLRTGIRLTLRIILGFMLFFVPGIVMSIRYQLWAPVVLMEGLEKKACLKRARALAARSWRTIIVAFLVQLMVPIIVKTLFSIMTGATTSGHQTVKVKVGSQLSELLNIFVMPLMAIVPALLYLKMRQFGGETISDVMSQIEDVEGARNKWQQRMRSRLSVTPRTPT